MYHVYGGGGLFPVIDNLFRVYQLLLLVRILCSWFPVDRRQTWYQYLYRATEPVLAPFRRLIGPVGMFDISPIAAFFALDVFRLMVLRVLT